MGRSSAAAAGALLFSVPRAAEATPPCWTFNGVVCVFEADIDPLSCFASESACSQRHPPPPGGCWAFTDAGDCDFVTDIDPAACSVSEADCRLAHLLCWSHVDGGCVQGGADDAPGCFPSEATCRSSGSGSVGGGGVGSVGGVGGVGDGHGCWVYEGGACHVTFSASPSECMTEGDCWSMGSGGGGSGSGGGCWMYTGASCVREMGGGDPSQCFPTQAECEDQMVAACWTSDGAMCINSRQHDSSSRCYATEDDCRSASGFRRRLQVLV